MKDFFVADAAQKENQPIVSYFAVTMKQVRAKKEGGEYLALTLADKSGQLDARMWDNFADCVPGFATGDVVKVQALVCRFADKLQLKIDKLRVAASSEFTLADFVPATEKNIDDLWAELTMFTGSLIDPHLHALANSFLDDPEFAAALRQAPAAKAMHHAFLGGMLEHIVSMLGLCHAVAGHYPQIHRDLLMIGALLHDVGKLTELKWGTSVEYTLEGTMLGHITIGISLIEKKIAALPGFPEPLRILVQHMVLSHHGQYEYGSPKLPMIPEAVLLHYIDDMDAKMQTIQAEFSKAAIAGKDAAGMTDWVRSMERPLLNTRAYLADAPQDRPAPHTEPHTALRPAPHTEPRKEPQHALPLED